MTLQTVHGAPSFGLRTSEVEAWVTRAGGHVAPVTFRVGNRSIQPFHVAPWHDEPLSDPPCIRVLRGDFFCMPFGGNLEPYEGEHHPIHGETANADWAVGEASEDRLVMDLDLTIRPGHVRKEIVLRPGDHAIYSRHTISGASGPMTLGHHAMLRFQTEGLVSTSPFAFGQVFPGEFENPLLGGYSSLRRGARFDRLDSVPSADGTIADLSRYPAREGFEDLVMVYSVQDSDFAWTAVTFPEEGYVWFSLKDPRVLTGTILWHSNGGRHYSPWNGRHRRVLGLEEVTAAMHYGLAGSVADSDASRAGFRTYFELNPGSPLVVNTIMGVAEVPSGFDAVAEVSRTEEGIVLTSKSGHTVGATVDSQWLYR